MDLACGIDVGTSGVRALICDPSGSIRASAAHPLPAGRAEGVFREQDARSWWEGVCLALREVTSAVDPTAIGAVAVDATSGTIVPVDRNLEPVGPGLMYHDNRATGYGDRVNLAAADFVRRHGYRFKDNFALPKMLWLRDHDPAFPRMWRILHQADLINARLIGDVPATDWSTALKSGCDLIEGGWGAFIGEQLGFPMEKLPPAVVAPGSKLGEVCRAAEAATGLKEGTPVVAGASDGTAALFGSGASQLGDFNTTVGSTLVLKGITQEIIHDPDGVVYCHRHPSGFWLPGGAGNVGCAVLNQEFAPDPATRGQVLRELDAQVDRHLPCPVLTYPLGDMNAERFPFRKSGLAGFLCGTPASPEEHYAAVLQGVAFVERWCYEKLENLGAAARRIFSTGGGSRSRVWTQLRADVLGKTILLPAEAETALGTAVLAAGYLRGDFPAACADMVQITGRVAPGSGRYEELYQQFRSECRKRWGV